VIDPFLAKLEELADRSKGKIREDVAHEKITAMGYDGSERTTRRAVAGLKAAAQAGRGRCTSRRWPSRCNAPKLPLPVWPDPMGGAGFGESLMRPGGTR
jgi:hypothetical protein